MSCVSKGDSASLKAILLPEPLLPAARLEALACRALDRAPAAGPLIRALLDRGLSPAAAIRTRTGPEPLVIACLNEGDWIAASLAFSRLRSQDAKPPTEATRAAMERLEARRPPAIPEEEAARDHLLRSLALREPQEEPKKSHPVEPQRPHTPAPRADRSPPTPPEPTPRRILDRGRLLALRQSRQDRDLAPEPAPTPAPAPAARAKLKKTFIG